MGSFRYYTWNFRPEKWERTREEDVWSVFLCCWLWCIIKKWKKRGICVKMRWKKKKRVKASSTQRWKLNELLISFFLCWVPFFRVKSCHPHTFTPPPPHFAVLSAKRRKISCGWYYLHDSTHFISCSNATFFLSLSPTLVLVLLLLFAGSSNLSEGPFILFLSPSRSRFSFFIVKWKIYRFSPKKTEGKLKGIFHPETLLMMENLCLY